jgi:hypothetical protein
MRQYLHSLRRLGLSGLYLLLLLSFLLLIRSQQQKINGWSIYIEQQGNK